MAEKITVFMEQASTTIHFKRECAQCGRDVIGVAIEEGRAKISGSSVDASIFRIQGRFKTVYSDWFCSRECAETYVRNYKGFVLASDVVAEQKKDVDEDDDEAEDEQEEFEDDEDSEDEENQIDNTPQFSEEELEENRRKAEFIRKAEEIKLADTSPDSIIEWYKNYLAFKSNADAYFDFPVSQSYINNYEQYGIPRKFDNIFSKVDRKAEIQTVAQSFQELRNDYASAFNYDSSLNKLLETAFTSQTERIVKSRISSILDKHNFNGFLASFFLTLPFMMSFEDIIFTQKTKKALKDLYAVKKAFPLMSIDDAVDEIQKRFNRKVETKDLRADKQFWNRLIKQTSGEKLSLGDRTASAFNFARRHKLVTLLCVIIISMIPTEIKYHANQMKIKASIAKTEKANEEKQKKNAEERKAKKEAEKKEAQMQKEAAADSEIDFSKSVPIGGLNITGSYAEYLTFAGDSLTVKADPKTFDVTVLFEISSSANIGKLLQDKIDGAFGKDVTSSYKGWLSPSITIGKKQITTRNSDDVKNALSKIESLTAGETDTIEIRVKNPNTISESSSKEQIGAAKLWAQDFMSQSDFSLDISADYQVQRKKSDGTVERKNISFKKK